MGNWQPCIFVSACRLFAPFVVWSPLLLPDKASDPQPERQTDIANAAKMKLEIPAVFK